LAKPTVKAILLNLARALSKIKGPSYQERGAGLKSGSVHRLGAIARGQGRQANEKRQDLPGKLRQIPTEALGGKACREAGGEEVLT
jgi:hypothetical protein